MNLTTYRIKQYNSTYKTVICADGVPICITHSNSRASKIISYLRGYDVEIKDGAIKKKLDKLLDK